MAKRKKVTKSDYEKSIDKAIEWLNRPATRQLDLAQLEKGVIELANRLRASMYVAGLIRKRKTYEQIASFINVDKVAVGRYLAGKQTPGEEAARRLEDMYISTRKRGRGGKKGVPA